MSVLQPFSSSELAAFDTPAKTAFMRAVYDAHIAWAQRGRSSFNPGLSKRDLLDIEGEGGHQARSDAASMCTKLLLQARADLKAAQGTGSGDAKLCASLGVQSAYRSAQQQFDRWRSLFPKYYWLTKDAREAAAGGAHGDSAIQIMVRFYRSRYGAPGFSLHNSGLAIDFNTRQGGTKLAADKTQVNAWKKAWFYRWLTTNAADFFFFQNNYIIEPWHWEFRGPGHSVQRPSTGDAEVTARCTFEHGDDYPEGGTARA